VITWAGPFNGEAHPSHTLRVEADTTRPRPHAPPRGPAGLVRGFGHARGCGECAGWPRHRAHGLGRPGLLAVRWQPQPASASTSLRRPSSALGTSQGHDTG
jgi:hypothetical protein